MNGQEKCRFYKNESRIIYPLILKNRCKKRKAAATARANNPLRELCCYNLDFYTMPDDEIQSVFAQQMQGADIGVIEGNKGLFDGMALDGADSNAGMAKLLKAPVVLVLDTQGTTRGVAPLVMGYQAFDADVNIAGIILNKVAGPRHEGKLREVLEHYTDVPVLGAIQRHADMHISERHLGLVPSNEAAESDAKINLMASRLNDHFCFQSPFN